jgi:hypothetical protein
MIKLVVLAVKQTCVLLVLSNKQTFQDGLRIIVEGREHKYVVPLSNLINAISIPFITLYTYKVHRTRI